eukprot:TRINITY_DN2150_c0_g1_i5.p1 TRINITY_DN2150_c0_g1~~TRINITY_DN2150_c0_g1_i5.p1  ORF type:complete len:298 (-),score=33.25 TRINITY_DN2150_c0_g1_i5:67-873(-)
MEQLFAHSLLPYTRFPAKTRDEAKDRMVTKGYKFSPALQGRNHATKWGTVACYLSHLDVLGSEAFRSNRSMVLITEDDLNLLADWQLQLTDAWQHLPGDWDIVKLCYFGQGRDADLANQYFFRARAPFINQERNGDFHYLGTCGYIVRPTSVQKLRHLLEMRARNEGIDDVDLATLEMPELTTYLLRNRVGTHGGHASDRLMTTDSNGQGYGYGYGYNGYGYGYEYDSGYEYGSKDEDALLMLSAELPTSVEARPQLFPKESWSILFM